MQARIAQGSVQRYWPAPGPTTQDYTLLNIAASVLSGTLKDRLYGEIVEKRKLATGAGAGLDGLEISSTFSIGVDLKPTSDREEIGRLVDREIALFLEKGP